MKNQRLKPSQRKQKSLLNKQTFLFQNGSVLTGKTHLIRLALLQNFSSKNTMLKRLKSQQTVYKTVGISVEKFNLFSSAA